MVHKLCDSCMNSCKQDETVKIIRCPRFRKRLSETEFRDLVNELDITETRAAELSRRVKDLISRALSVGPGTPHGTSGDSPEPSDTDERISEPHPREKE